MFLHVRYENTKPISVIVRNQFGETYGHFDQTLNLPPNLLKYVYEIIFF